MQPVPAPVRTAIREAELEPWPLPAGLVTKGRPQASGRVLWRSDDGRRAIAIYRCTPGCFGWTFETDETVTCLEGHAVVTTSDGATVELRAGDVCHFSSGLMTDWDIRETLLDSVVLFSEGGIPL